MLTERRPHLLDIDREGKSKSTLRPLMALPVSVAFQGFLKPST